MNPIEQFRIRTIASGLKLEAVGLRRSRGPSCLTLAKTLTGLKTNDHSVQREALLKMVQS